MTSWFLRSQAKALVVGHLVTFGREMDLSLVKSLVRMNVELTALSVTVAWKKHVAWFGLVW